MCKSDECQDMPFGYGSRSNFDPVWALVTMVYGGFKEGRNEVGHSCNALFFQFEMTP